MAWTNANTLKTAATVAWADETRAAIVTHDGMGTTVSAGLTVTFTTPYALVTDYRVEMGWNEDPGASGALYAVKSVGSCLCKVQGSIFGKSFWYKVCPVKSL